MIDWNDKQVLNAAQVGIHTALKSAANYGASFAKRKVRVRTGELRDSIKVKPSNYRNGGYVIGVFDANKVDFEKSKGAKAVYVEYGHAAPNQGRGSGVKRRDITKSVKPSPFLRPAMRAIKRNTNRFFEDVL